MLPEIETDALLLQSPSQDYSKYMAAGINFWRSGKEHFQK
jgi:hypothetical protein